MRVVFLGSPDDVIVPLQALFEKGPALGHELIAVVSQPAKPVGRGGKMADPPVAAWAKEHGIKTIQPVSAKDSAFLDELRPLAPDIMVTAAYGQILSNDFLAIPRRGTINIHPSLLPLYRGAIPVNAALLDGKEESGISILFTVQKLDAGNVILQERSRFADGETAGEATVRMFAESAPLLLRALDILKDEAFVGTPQDEARVTHCRKMKKEDGLLSWGLTRREIINRYRGYTPWPGVTTFMGGKRVTLLGIDVAETLVSENQSGAAGSVSYDKPRKVLRVACADGSVCVTRLQPEGGKVLAAADFWNGLKQRDGVMFGSGGV